MGTHACMYLAVHVLYMYYKFQWRCSHLYYRRNHDSLFLCRYVCSLSLSLSACRERETHRETDRETRERKEEKKKNPVVIQSESPFTSWLPEIASSMLSASPPLPSPPCTSCSVQTGCLYNMMNRKWSDSNAQQVQHSMLLFSVSFIPCHYDNPYLATARWPPQYDGGDVVWWQQWIQHTFLPHSLVLTNIILQVLGPHTLSQWSKWLCLGSGGGHGGLQLSAALCITVVRRHVMLL